MFGGVPRLQFRRKPIRMAFSLIELVAVILLMAILAAVAAPRWTTALEEFRATAAARRIVQDLTLAQRTAITASRSQRVSFSVATNSYSLSQVVSLDRASADYVTLLSEDPYRTRFISLFGTLSNQQLVFNGFGVPDRSGAIVIACGQSQRTIAVNADTGLAQYLE